MADGKIPKRFKDFYGSMVVNIAYGIIMNHPMTQKPLI